MRRQSTNSRVRPQVPSCRKAPRLPRPDSPNRKEKRTRIPREGFRRCARGAPAPDPGARTPSPSSYPFLQRGGLDMTVVVRARSDPVLLLERIRERVRPLDPSLPLYIVKKTRRAPADRPRAGAGGRSHPGLVRSPRIAAGVDSACTESWRSGWCSARTRSGSGALSERTPGRPP